MGHAETLAPFLLSFINIDADDFICADHTRSLQDIQPNPAQTKDNDICARFYLGRICHSAHTRRHAAANVTAFVKRRVGPNFSNSNFWQDRMIGEGRAAHIMINRLALIRKARGAIGHDAFALRGANGGTEISFPREARFTLTAFGRVEWNNVVAHRDGFYALTNLAHNARTLMTEDTGEEPLTIKTVQGVSIRMANPRCHNFNQHFTRFWAL